MDYQRQVARLMAQRWQRLERDTLDHRDLKHPGVYLVSMSPVARAGKSIRVTEIDYVGMTVAVGGLRQRLRAFLRGAGGKRGHSGGVRLSKVRGQEQQLYFAYHQIEANTRKGKRSGDDLRKMGHVACLKYHVLAHVKSTVDREPQFHRN